jgi:hypothetical protein
MKKSDEVLEHIIIIEVYILLTILAFHKIFILGIDKWVIGDHGDAWHFIWNFWWIKKALLEHRNLFYTNEIFYPTGASLYFHTLTLTDSLLAFPLSFIFDWKIIYNLLVLKSFILSAFFMYLLLKSIAKSVPFSFLGGLYYSFNGYHVSKTIAHLNFLAVEWFPIHFYFLFKLVKSPNFKVNHFILAILTFLFCTFAELSYGYYLAILDSLFIIFFIIKKEPFKLTRRIILVLIISLLFLIAFYFPAIREYYLSSDQYMKRRLSFNTHTFWNYFLPSPFSTLSFLFNDSVIKLYSKTSYVLWFVDIVVSLGPLLFLTVIFIFMINLRRHKFWKRFRFSSIYLFYIISLAIFFYLSLGTTVLGGEILRLLPLYETIGNPSRAAAMVIFLFTLFVFSSLSEITSSKMFPLFLLLIVLFENFPVYNLSFYKVDIPLQLYSIKKEPQNFAILNIPHRGNTQGMFLQTIHEHKIIDGMIARIPRKSLVYVEKVEGLVKEGKIEDSIKILKQIGVKYVIVNRNYHYPYDLSLVNLLSTNETMRIDKEGNVEVYQIL